MSRFFYWPERGESLLKPDAVGFSFEDVWFKSQDGTRLNGWYVPAANARAVVLLAHGNAGRIGDHFFNLIWLLDHGYSVFSFDYRGFGLSDDVPPNPRNAMEDTQAAIDWVRGRPDIKQLPIILVGQSLGGNNALAALANGDRSRIAGLVLDATFYSYRSIANDRLYGSGLLMSNAYGADKFIASISPLPILILHGKADQVIGYHHSERLFATAKQPKIFIGLEQPRHLEMLAQPAVREAVLQLFGQWVGN